MLRLPIASWRLTLEAATKELEKAMYEWGKVEKVVDRRGDSKWREYLVEWHNGGNRELVKAAWVAEDLVKDFLIELEYAIAEAVVDKRQVQTERGNGRTSPLVLALSPTRHKTTLKRMKGYLLCGVDSSRMRFTWYCT